MIDLQKRMGQVPDPACSGVLSPERPNCGWLKPSEQAPIPELAILGQVAASRLPVFECKGKTGVSSPSGTLPSGATAGAKRSPFLCPQCSAEIISVASIGVCSSDDCDWNEYRTAFETRSATTPMGSNASSDPSPSMLSEKQEGTSKCHNILAVGQQ